jgi:hypothetical protein
MNQVLFINVQYLKDASTYDLNLDDKLLISSIVDCQLDYLRPILGSGLFNDLIEKVRTNSISGANQTLLQNYVQPCLAKYVLYDVQEELLYKYSNKSIEKQKSDTTDPISEKELYNLKGKRLDKAQAAGTRLNDYLIANQDLFPLFVNPGTSYDTVIPNRTDDYMYGIYTSKKGSKKNWGWDLPSDQHPIL